MTTSGVSRRADDGPASCDELAFAVRRPPGETDARTMRRLRGAVGLEIGACLGQRQRSIGTTTDEVGIVVVLAVVLPIADRADLEPAALTQG